MFLCFAQKIALAWTNQQRHCLNKLCDQVDGKAVSTTSLLYIYEKKKKKKQKKRKSRLLPSFYSTHKIVQVSEQFSVF